MCARCDPAELLAKAGLRPTKNRLAVLAAMLDAHEALAPLEILQRVRQARHLDKVTLYRTLDALQRVGLADRHEDGEGHARFCALCALHPAHHHFYCQHCKRLICLEPDAVRLDCHAPDGAELSRVSVRLEGLCPSCS